MPELAFPSKSQQKEIEIDINKPQNLQQGLMDLNQATPLPPLNNDPEFGDQDAFFSKPKI